MIEPIEYLAKALYLSAQDNKAEALVPWHETSAEIRQEYKHQAKTAIIALATMPVDKRALNVAIVARSVLHNEVENTESSIRQYLQSLTRHVKEVSEVRKSN